MNAEEVKNFLVQQLNVSHETLLNLEKFVTFLMQWNEVHNLISQNSVQDLWHRHLLDSAQLINFIKRSDMVVDFGAGAGFPGIILATLGYKVCLVERNKKKTAFLVEAARRLNLEVVIRNQSIEETEFKNIDIITARGVGKIGTILEITKHLMPMNPSYLLQKGKEWQGELDEAAVKWNFVAQPEKSTTSDDGKIIRLTKVSKKHG